MFFEYPVVLTLKSVDVFYLPKDRVVVVAQVADGFGVERRNGKTLPQQKFLIDYFKRILTRILWRNR